MLVVVGLALVVAGVWGVSTFEANHAQTMQAQAAAEIARAAQLDAAGHTAATTGLSVSLVLVLLIVTLAVIGYLFFKLRAAQSHHWAAGPNARWRIMGSNPQGLGISPQTFQMLLQMQMLQMFQQMLGQSQNTTLTYQRRPELPRDYEEEEAEWSW